MEIEIPTTSDEPNRQGSIAPSADNADTRETGGFLLPQPSLAKSPGPGSTIVKHPRPLPNPRSVPLKPGRKPEASLIRYLDDALQNISRKYTKKYTPGGYSNIQSIVKDLDVLVDLIWVSSTPNLQIQYLLRIANDFNDYLSSFMVQLRTTFTFLDVLDRCFYALLTGQSTDPVLTPISPSMASSRITTTEKVRLNSIVQRTRLHVVKIIEEGPSGIAESHPDEVEDVNMSTGSASDIASRGTTPATDLSGIGRDSEYDHDERQDEEDDEEDELEMAVARVYEHTLSELSEQLERTL
ncbi:hypothetical protein BDZ91DRAFT_853803 [Kalaharituber pfeilii]|nr:hypothetical protein BDZ91DRAFT_853803 [Kalaharituber pfeilii]